MTKAHKPNPGKHMVSREKLIEVLKPFDKDLSQETKNELYAARVEAVSEGVRWFLRDYALPDTRYHNSDLCRAIGQCVDLPVDTQLSISRSISFLGKQEEFKPYIRPGRTMTNRRKGGAKTKQRVRDWFALPATPEEAEEIHQAFNDGKTILESAEEAQMSAMQFLAREGWSENHLLAARPDSMRTSGPTQAEDVHGVDNSNISRHPIPNAARVDCGQCGGSGKVYMKQEPKS